MLHSRCTQIIGNETYRKFGSKFAYLKGNPTTKCLTDYPRTNLFPHERRNPSQNVRISCPSASLGNQRHLLRSQHPPWAYGILIMMCFASCLHLAPDTFRQERLSAVGRFTVFSLSAFPPLGWRHSMALLVCWGVKALIRRRPRLSKDRDSARCICQPRDARRGSDFISSGD